jgi:hypothetical protein
MSIIDKLGSKFQKLDIDLVETRKNILDDDFFKQVNQFYEACTKQLKKKNTNLNFRYDDKFKNFFESQNNFLIISYRNVFGIFKKIKYAYFLRPNLTIITWPRLGESHFYLAKDRYLIKEERQICLVNSLIENEKKILRRFFIKNTFEVKNIQQINSKLVITLNKKDANPFTFVVLCDLDFKILKNGKFQTKKIKFGVDSFFFE